MTIIFGTIVKDHVFMDVNRRNKKKIDPVFIVLSFKF
jgi:hypothetical protein